MPLLKAEAEKLSNNDLLRGVVEEVIDRDETFALLPFTRVDGKAHVYNRETTVVESAFVDPNETITEAAAAFQEVVARLRIMAQDVDIDKFLAGTMSDTNSQLAVQLAAKAKGIARTFKKTFVTGNSGTSPKEFDGILQLAAGAGASQNIVVGANGAALTLSMLDELLDAVPNGADAIVMRAGTLRAYRALLRAAGGATPDSYMLENFGRPLPAHNGVPILVNDFLPGNIAQGSAPNTCSVFAIRMNEDDGLHGLYGGDSAGFVVEDIGTVQNKDAWRYRMKWYAGLALKSTKSIARLQGVTNV